MATNSRNSAPKGPEDFRTEWHRVVAEKDLDALPGLLAEDVSLGSPPYWERLEGRERVAFLLGLILQTIEDFSYQREWWQGREAALEFTGHVGDRQLQGIDLVTLDERGVIGRLDVVIRPANAIEALREVVAPRMTEFLARRQEGSP